MLDFIEQAAEDPDVLAIKQTLYRTSGDSQIVGSLAEAAESGKQVTVVIELKARFDEAANIKWARTLQEAGVHVVYGIVGLKTHAKLALVVRREEDGLRRYLHLGTGNYHPSTAKLYTDFGLLTCDPELTNDSAELFNWLTGVSIFPDLKKIKAAPKALHDFVLEMIDRETQNAKKGQAGRNLRQSQFPGGSGGHSGPLRGFSSGRENQAFGPRSLLFALKCPGNERQYYCAQCDRQISRA